MVRRPRMPREYIMAEDTGHSGDELLWCRVEGRGVDWSEAK